MEIIIKKVLSSMITLMLMMNILGLMPADAVGEMDDVNSYTLFANSCDFDAISISSCNFNINGAMCTNGKIETNCNINSETKELANRTLPDLNDKILNRFYSEDYSLYSESYIWNDINVNINTPIICDDTITLDGNVLLNKSIMSNGQMTLKGNLNVNGEISLCSKNGDIVIESENVSFSGLIYAPNGTVTFNSNNVNLNNTVIIADKICFNSPNVNISKNNELLEYIDNETIINDNIIGDPKIEIFAYYDCENNIIELEWDTDLSKILI